MAANSPCVSPSIPSARSKGQQDCRCCDTELDCPETARGEAAGVDRDRPVQLSVARDEGFYFAVLKAEVSDQHFIAESAEAGRYDGNPPRCREAAARDQFLDEVAVFIEDRHGPAPNGALISAGR